MKVPFAYIGKAKNPRCFRKGQLPVSYFSQKSAFSDRATFRKWFYLVFCFICEKKNFEKSTPRHGQLWGPWCGSFRSHRASVSNHSSTQLNFNVSPIGYGNCSLPKSAISIYAFKKMLEVFENISQLREAAKNLAARLQGLDEGHDLHIFHVAEMLEDVSENVTKRTIARCWTKSDILPKRVNRDLINRHGKVSGKKNSGLEIEIEKLIDVFRSFK